ncbi:tetratricopeptide repeat protein [Trichothermofontia sp.]
MGLGMGLGISLLLVLCLAQPVVAAETDLSPSVSPSLSSPSRSLATSNGATDPFWEKLELLRQDKQLQQLMEEDLEKSIVIRSQIQTEVDRAFEHTTTLLNTLIAVLTFLPVLAAASIWFIRRSVLNQIVAETRKQLQEEIGKHLESEVMAEFAKQTEAFQQKIEQLEAEFNAQLEQLKSLLSDTEKDKDTIIRELSQITPSLLREFAPPETQEKIQHLMQRLEQLKSSNAELSFTAHDYIEQGKALYFEGEYDGAIACYDKAIQMEADNPKAWFSRGIVLAKLQQLEAAIAAYDRVLAAKPDASEAWFAKGAALAKLNQLDDAIAAYATATRLKADFFLAWMGQARCYALKGDVANSLTHLQTAIALNPEKVREAIRVDAAFEALHSQAALQAILNSQ